MSELTRLTNYLTDNGISNYVMFKHSEKFNEFNDVFENMCKKSKYVNKRTVLEFIKMGCDITCPCGSGLETTWDQNNACFRKVCKQCMKKVDPKKIKESRRLEMLYDGQILSKEQVSLELDNIPNFEDFLGSGKQRTFIKKHRQLYFSILHHTKNIDLLKGVSLRARILSIRNADIHLCKCGNMVKDFDNNKLTFHPVCVSCIPRRDSIEWFKLYHPQEWEKKYREMKERKRLSAKDLHTLKWYIEKYGK